MNTEPIFEPFAYALMAVVWAVVGILTRVFELIGPGARKAWAYVLPLAPLLFAGLGYLLAGPESMPTRERLVLGLALGAVTAQLHKIGKQSVLGRDSWIQGRSS